MKPPAWRKIGYLLGSLALAGAAVAIAWLPTDPLPGKVTVEWRGTPVFIRHELASPAESR